MGQLRRLGHAFLILFQDGYLSFGSVQFRRFICTNKVFTSSRVFDRSLIQMLRRQRFRCTHIVSLDFFPHKVIKIKAATSVHVNVVKIIPVLSETVARFRPLTAIVRVKTDVVCPTVA
jgi:hypothetical protein